MTEKGIKKSVLFSTWMGIGGQLGLVYIWGAWDGFWTPRATFYSAYGSWGFIMPFIAMAILGFVVYMVVEYMRINKLNRYIDFFSITSFHHMKKFLVSYSIYCISLPTL